MPQKIGAGGKMQNYVPAGNPAGGEYGDSEGNNKNFKTFKKPREYKKYWEKTRPDSLSASGISKKEYDKLLQTNPDLVYSTSLNPNNYYDKMLLDWIQNNPDLEQRVLDAINSIDMSLIKNRGNLSTQLFLKLGIRNNYEKESLIINAFSDEIEEKYLEAVKPKLDAINSINAENCKEKFYNAVDSLNINDDFKEHLKTQFELGNDESKVLTTVLMEGYDLKYQEQGGKKGTFFRPSGFFCQLESKHDTSEYYEKGQVFYHETYHALDYKFGNWSGSSHYTSTSFKGSNGLTLLETLKKEGMGVRGKKLIEKIQSDYRSDDWRREIAKSKGIDFDKIINNYNEFDKEKSKLFKEVFGEDDFIDDEDPRNEKYNQKLMILISKYGNAFAEKNNMMKEINKEKYRVWGDISDMVCGCTRGQTDLIGFGHNASYFSSDVNAKAHEFFAECGSAKSCNSASYKLIQKYFPETTKVFNEILEHINSDKTEVIKR